jgi:hypothetical protein
MIIIFLSSLKQIRILSDMIRFYASSLANILYSSNKVMTYNINYTAKWDYIQSVSEEKVNI